MHKRNAVNPTCFKAKLLKAEMCIYACVAVQKPKFAKSGVKRLLSVYL